MVFMKTQSRMFGIVVLGALLASALPACVNAVKGSGKIVSEDRNVGSFRQVALSGNGELFIVQGQKEFVRVEADDNILPHLRTEVLDDTLKVGYGDKDGNIQVFSTTKNPKIYVGTKSLEGIAVSGSGQATAGIVHAGKMQIKVAGSGRVLLGQLKARSLTTDISGSGNVEIGGGAVVEQKVDVSGSGEYDSKNLESRAARLKLSGSGHIAVWAIDKLDISSSGSGTVQYYGRPQVAQQVSGSSSVQSLGAREVPSKPAEMPNEPPPIEAKNP
jgi:hypothetical protein